MKKVSLRHMLAVLICLGVIVALAGFAVAQQKAPEKAPEKAGEKAPAKAQEKGKEQFGSVKGELVPSEPVAPVKDNICRNPKLCESLEIDMLTNLQKAKLPIFLPPPPVSATTKDYKVALDLGLAVCDALSCVINKDKAAFPKYSGLINDYAKKLGIPEAVLSKYAKINETAEKGEWDKLGTLVYEFKDEITTELGKKNQQGVATLSMASGGLEGLYIVAKSVDNKFSPDSAPLLRNTEFVKYLDFNIKSVGIELNTKEEVKAMVAALPKIDKIINKPKEYAYTQADAKELVSVLESLRKTMVSD